MKLRNVIKEFSIITVGTAIVAAAVFFFMLPSHVSVGSGAALAMVLSNFIPLPVSTITLIMNVGLLIIGFILIGPEFGVKTVYCSILMPVIMGILENLSGLPVYHPGSVPGCNLLYFGCRCWPFYFVLPKCFFRWPGYRGQDPEQVPADGSW